MGDGAERRSTRLGGHLGARIDGVDLARGLDDDTFSWVREQLRTMKIGPAEAGPMACPGR